MALKGIKVLEFAGLAPAPFCGMILADFGASVTRIDKLQPMDMVDILGNGKKTIALDLKKSEAIKVIKQLSNQSDVLIDPFRAGVLEKLGLGPDILCKENARLVYSRLTGYGQSGNFAKRAGHDINYMAMSGFLSLLGRKNEKPLFPINYAADFAGGGLVCAFGIVMALFERAISGKGQVIDSNMTEGTAYVSSWLARSQNTMLFTNARGENLLDSGAHFYDVYETKDGKFMAVGAIEPQFYQELLDGLCLSLDEAPYLDFEEGKKLFTKKFLEKTQEEWSQIYESTDACVTPILSYEEAANHPHNKQRKSFLVKDGVVIPKPAPILSRTPGQSRGSEPKLRNGEHTVDILQNLGYTAKEIKQLDEDGVISIASSKL
ncbi:alpha-methylacyl-CoA racemase [Atheta coriaria]|uniref:alpha-methylacyl-CoA racemase n=1 Tax=Dalotia coriaria TaxID=877792 RepID=UPI0031F3DEBF